MSIPTSAADCYDDEAVVSFYERLRATNPHLPPANMIVGSPPLKLSFGRDNVPTLTIEIYVKLPEEAKP